MNYFLKNHKKNIVVIIILAFVVSALNIYGAYLLGDLLNSAVKGSLNSLLTSILQIIVVWGCWYILNKYREDYNAYFKSLINNELRLVQARKIDNLSNDEWEEKAPSEYLGKFTTEIEQIDKNSLDTFTDFIYCIFTLLFSIVALLSIHWIIVILSIFMFLIMAILPDKITKKMNELTKQYADENEKMIATTTDCLNGRNEYIQYDSDHKFLSRIHEASKETEMIRKKLQYSTNTTDMIINIVGFIFQCLLISITALLSIKGITPIGCILTVGNLAGTFTQSLSAIISDFSKVKANESLFPVCNFQDENIQKDKVLPISIKNLTSIKIGEHLVQYSNISMDLKKNGRYLLIGESGKGKSTLLKGIFVNNLEYDGNISLAEMERKKIKVKNINGNFAYISQNGYVFNDTLRNNLCMGKNIDDEMCCQMINNLKLDEFFDRCGNNLNYIIENQGKNISGGEKQKICIARAIMSGKEILVLDESLSSMDKESIDAVLSYLFSLKDKTIIMTAHNIGKEYYNCFTKVISL